MIQFNYLPQNDYDRIVRVGGVDVYCYSKKKMKQMGASVTKEARAYSQSELTPDKNGVQKKAAAKRVGELDVNSTSLGVALKGANNPFFYKAVGYLMLADGSYTALCVSRIPFLITLAALLLALSTVGGIVIWNMATGNLPTILTPDNPLPDIDDNIIPDEDEGGGYEGEAGDVPEGGGKTPMVYSTESSYYLAQERIIIYFKNPSRSTHDAVLEYYIVQGDQEYLIASTGRIPAGYRIRELSPREDAPTLSQGVYKGLYRISYYDPYTGVRSRVQSDLTDIKVSVKP